MDKSKSKNEYSPFQLTTDNWPKMLS